MSTFNRLSRICSMPMMRSLASSRSGISALSANPESKRSLMSLLTGSASKMRSLTSGCSVRRSVWTLHHPELGLLSYMENGLILWTQDPAVALSWMDPQQAATRLRRCDQLQDILSDAYLIQADLSTTSTNYPFLWHDEAQTV